MSASLLDTNVLLALAWPNHQHHDLAHRWFSNKAKRGWATCAVVQLGFIRLSSNPAYTKEAVSPGEAAELLRRLMELPEHQFWPSPEAGRLEIYARAIGHQQVNDAWLVAVAEQNGGRLVTLDQRAAIHAPSKRLVEVIT